MSESEHESRCLMCVMNFLKRLIDIENDGIEVDEFTPQDLLFVIGEKVTDQNVADMAQAKEHFYVTKYIEHMR